MGVEDPVNLDGLLVVHLVQVEPLFLLDVSHYNISQEKTTVHADQISSPPMTLRQKCLLRLAFTKFHAVCVQAITKQCDLSPCSISFHTLHFFYSLLVDMLLIDVNLSTCPVYDLFYTSPHHSPPVNK